MHRAITTTGYNGSVPGPLLRFHEGIPILVAITKDADIEAGAWKIAVRSRNQVQRHVTYSIRETMLLPLTSSIEAGDAEHPSGASWTQPLPKTQSDAQYAAFRIVGTPGVESEKEGLLIAMTPLADGAP